MQTSEPSELSFVLRMDNSKRLRSLSPLVVVLVKWSLRERALECDLEREGERVSPTTPKSRKRRSFSRPASSRPLLCHCGLRWVVALTPTTTTFSPRRLNPSLKRGWVTAKWRAWQGSRNKLKRSGGSC